MCLRTGQPNKRRVARTELPVFLAEILPWVRMRNRFTVLPENLVGPTGAGIEGASFAIGTLSFNAPMVEDIYTLDLNGGTLQGGSPTATYLADGVNFLLPGTNLDLDSFVYVTPEPGSMLLFAVGGLALLRHRRKAA